MIVSWQEKSIRPSWLSKVMNLLTYNSLAYYSDCPHKLLVLEAVGKGIGIAKWISIHFGNGIGQTWKHTFWCGFRPL